MWRRSVFPEERVEGPQLKKFEEGMHVNESDANIRTTRSKKEGT